MSTSPFNKQRIHLSLLLVCALVFMQLGISFTDVAVHDGSVINALRQQQNPVAEQLVDGNAFSWEKAGLAILPQYGAKQHSVQHVLPFLHASELLQPVTPDVTYALAHTEFLLLTPVAQGLLPDILAPPAHS